MSDLISREELIRVIDHRLTHTYAQIEPLSEAKAEVFERFNTVSRIMQDLGISCAYDMPSFWYNNKKDYMVIPTRYHQGYMKALEDVEKEVRKRFGFAERENVVDYFFNPFKPQSEQSGHER